MSKNDVNNLVVVIRSAYERTEALCEHLVKKQAPEERVVIIHERPFVAALRRAYQIGIDYGLEWTLCIDADVMIRERAISDLLETAGALPGEFFGAQGYVFDKFRNEPNLAGIHLYRTSLLSKALALIDDSGVNPRPVSSTGQETTENHDELLYSPELRPENYVKHEMKKLGHDWFLDERTLGLHDFEQYYVDIFRKMVVNAIKISWAFDSMMNTALMYAKTDPDYLVATWGLRVGRGFDGCIDLDVEQWESEAKFLLLANEMEEKERLPIERGCVLANRFYEEKSFQHGNSRPQITREKADGFLMVRLYSGIFRLGWKIQRAGLRVQRVAARRIRERIRQSEN